MTLEAPLLPPVPPMLARLARTLPEGGYLYEPKWDGFRALAFRAGDDVELQSRHGNELGRYFPELVEALRTLPDESLVLDGEVVLVAGGRFDFTALMARIHPAASRVERLRAETPASFVAFDLLAHGRELLLERPYVERRALLEEALRTAGPPLFLTPVTRDPAAARAWLDRFQGGGVDGVVAKREDAPYEPGRRTLVKVKREHTADCVVAGYRWLTDRPELGSLLLGLHDDRGALEHVGVVTGLAAARRRDLLAELRPLEVPLEGHPWEHGFLAAGGPTGRLKGAAGRWLPGMVRDWVPLAPVRVAEVAYDQLDGLRFRHPARFRRWRPDREPSSCSLHQLTVAPVDAAEVLLA